MLLGWIAFFFHLFVCLFVQQRGQGFSTRVSSIKNVTTRSLRERVPHKPNQYLLYSTPTWVKTTGQASRHAARILQRDLPPITEAIAFQIRRDLLITSTRSCVFFFFFFSKGVCHEKPFAVDRMACHRKAFSLQTHRTWIRSCGLVRNLQFVPDGRLYEKRLGTTPFLQSQHVTIVEISIHNRKPSGQDVAQREHDVAMRMAFSREANQRSIGRSFFDELRLRHHFVENMRILSITRGCKVKKVHCSRGTKRSFVWRHGRFRGREDTRTPWSRRDESHAPFPSRYNDDTAGHCDLAPPCNTDSQYRETTLRINAMPKTEKTEGLVRISVHRFHTDSHREMLVADLLRFGTQRPAEVDGGSFRSEGIGKRLRQGLRLLWMVPRSQNYYHNNR